MPYHSSSINVRKVIAHRGATVRSRRFAPQRADKKKTKTALYSDIPKVRPQIQDIKFCRKLITLTPYPKTTDRDTKAEEIASGSVVDC